MVPADTNLISMRILFLKDDPYLPDLYAGVELNTHYLALQLRARGHEVAVAALGKGTTNIVVNNDLGYAVYRGPRLTVLAAHAKRHFVPDVMVNQNRALLPYLIPKVERREIPTVFYEHAVLPKAKLPSTSLRARALCAVNSPMLAAHLLKTLGVGSIVVPPIFGVERYAHLVPAPRHVTMISIQRRKGTDIALGLATRRPDVPFVFVESWTENSEETRDLRQRLESLPNVRVVENRPDLSDIIRATRLLLMPSRSQEAWGRIVTECQLLGIPVLGSRRGSLIRTIGNGGITLDPDDDPALWSAAFDGLWDQGSTWDRFSECARQHASAILRSAPQALERFEFLLHAAQPARFPVNSQILSLQREQAQTPDLERSDLVRVQKIQAEVEALSHAEASLPRLARQFAGKPDEVTAACISRATGLPLEPNASDLAATAAANREETVLQCLKGLSRHGWAPKIAVVGKSHLDRALASGNGAIVWVIHTTFASNVVKMALHGTGFRLSQVSRPEHGVSKSKLGMRCLNRVRTDFEDRFLQERILIDRNNPGAAMLRARRRLLRNEVVAITAGAWEGGTFIDQEFPGGRLKLATGPLRLALLSGAALLPVSGVRLPNSEDFEVRIEHPLQLSSGANDDERLRAGFAQFAAYIARVMILYPAQLRGWSDLVR